MKILDIPQSGKRGRTVSQDGAFGQVSRTLVIPKDPQTEAQLNRRQVLGMLAHNWRSIAEASRVAWNKAGKLVKSAARLGQSRPLSGFLLFVKVNCNLELVGEAAVELCQRRAEMTLLFTGRGIRRVPIEYFEPADLANAKAWLMA